MIEIISGIFTAIGVLAFTALILYLIAKYLKKYKPSKPNKTDSEYMNLVGDRCPSGWEYIGAQKDSNGVIFDVCQNIRNIPVCKDWAGNKEINGKNVPGCYSDAKSQMTIFPHIKDWSKNDSNTKRAIKARCNWVNGCGPPFDVHGNPVDEACSASPPAFWPGLDDKC